jgi:hypothetical protein
MCSNSMKNPILITILVDIDVFQAILSDPHNSDLQNYLVTITKHHVGSQRLSVDTVKTDPV